MAPDARGQGVADSLLTTAMDAARAQGIWQIELSVYVENQRAIALYDRHGFSVTGKIPNALLGDDGSEDDLLMIRIFDRTWSIRRTLEAAPPARYVPPGMPRGHRCPSFLTTATPISKRGLLRC